MILVSLDARNLPEYDVGQEYPVIRILGLETTDSHFLISTKNRSSEVVKTFVMNYGFSQDDLTPFIDSYELFAP